MVGLIQQLICCPYCGESIEVLIDHEDAGQQYIEDCQVCCKPITFHLSIDMHDGMRVDVYDEDTSF
ncbi:MAG: CPXCG motif-containing cysteine-rich protein [Pseudomonadota bacterium]